MNRSTIFFTCLLFASFRPSFSAEHDAALSGNTVIREMNLARQNPVAYAAYVENLRPHYRGREGFAALDEAIRFLRSAKPLQPLAVSPGMCRGTADHCAEQAGGGMGHGNPPSRMKRYGTWAAAWGEN